MSKILPLFTMTCVLLAACQERAPAVTTAGTAATAPATACTRLSEVVAAHVLALPAAQAHPEQANACHWDSGKPDTPFPILSLSVNAYNDETSAIKLFEATSAMQSKLSKGVNAALGEKTRRSGRAPEGVGDEAWLQLDDVAGTDTAMLVVRKGRAVYTLGVVGMGSMQGLPERLEAAGRAVVGQP